MEDEFEKLLMNEKLVSLKSKVKPFLYVCNLLTKYRELRPRLNAQILKDHLRIGSPEMDILIETLKEESHLRELSDEKLEEMRLVYDHAMESWKKLISKSKWTNLYNFYMEIEKEQKRRKQ